MVVATMDGLNSRSNKCSIFFSGKARSATIGILAFDAAKTMSRLVSLYYSLADVEILRLRNETVRSKGVVYLNSVDERFLLNLASTERLDDLDHAAATVARLGKNCTDSGLIDFELFYSDMKQGKIGIARLDFSSKGICKLIQRMVKLLHSTSQLHSTMESLVEMEVSERKLDRWKNGLDPKQCPSANLEYFRQKISTQRIKVKRWKGISLWNQSFDNVVGIMARLVCIIYSRICTIFRPFFYDQPHCLTNKLAARSYKFHIESTGFFSRSTGERCPDNPDNVAEKRKKCHRRATKPSPIPKIVKKEMVRLNRESSNLIIPANIGSDIRNTGKISGSEIINKNSVYKLAPSSTVGGSGLSLNYANVIIFAERCLHAPATVSEEVRGKLYDMLPSSIKAMIRRKLRGCREEEDEWGSEEGHGLAEGWRDALEEIMEWLAPVAHDTVRWQSERRMEKQMFDPRPRALALQTLHYSDLEKTEVAISEVLVGLSYIHKYENRRSCNNNKT